MNVAKQRRGLGRGLNSLLGESLGEIEQKNEREETAAREERRKRDEQRREEERRRQEERKREADLAAAEEARAASRNATVTEQAAEEATIKERPAMRMQRTEEEAREIAAEQEIQRTAINEKIDAPKPYIEEDDHVTIKSVAIRERKQESQQTGELEVPLSTVVPNPDQPRTNFNREEIAELAQSIEKEGLLQPILVRRAGEGYQIIAGERRWQACKKLGMKQIPIRVKDVPDDKALELALIENIQRADLNPIEEAYGYKRLMERRGMTQSEVAQAVSKGRSTIANALRLLDLPEDAQQLLFEEKITAGHARAILSVPTKEGRQKLTKKLQEEKLSVRETENLARLFAGQAQNQGSTTKRVPLPASFKKAAKGLRESLNTNVRIKTVKGKNKIEIEFKDEDELERLFKRIVEEV